MAEIDLFQAALGLPDPWRVVGAEFSADRQRLDLYLDFPKGVRFACPEGDAAACAVHDTSDKTWRHLDFFQHRAYLHARVPRVTCPTHGVRQVALVWARPESGFTLLFAACCWRCWPRCRSKPSPSWSASTTPGCGACCTTTSPRPGSSCRWPRSLGSGSMRPRPAAARTTSACSSTWTHPSPGCCSPPRVATTPPSSGSPPTLWPMTATR